MQSGKSKYGLSDDTEESLLIFESVWMPLQLYKNSF